MLPYVFFHAVYFWAVHFLDPAPLVAWQLLGPRNMLVGHDLVLRPTVDFTLVYVPVLKIQYTYSKLNSELVMVDFVSIWQSQSCRLPTFPAVIL